MASPGRSALIRVVAAAAVRMRSPEEDAGTNNRMRRRGDEQPGEATEGDEQSGEPKAGNGYRSYFYPRIYEGTLRLSTGEGSPGLTLRNRCRITHEITRLHIQRGTEVAHPGADVL